MRLTTQAHAKLQAERTHLVDVELPAARAMIEDSRTQGDSSQNPDYFIAAEAEGALLARLRRIEAALAAHESAAAGPLDTSVVQPGVVVELDFGGDVEEFYVGPIEQAGNGFEVLTPDSPVGQAVIGAKVGDTVNAGRVQVRVNAIRSPE